MTISIVKTMPLNSHGKMLRVRETTERVGEGRNVVTKIRRDLVVNGLGTWAHFSLAEARDLRDVLFRLDQEGLLTDPD